MTTATPFESPHLPDPVPPSPVTERFEFTGSGSEYFRIWIVNLLLSIVTLGIYSAWAKVRRTRYFYDNTRLAGTSFEYHGSAIAILKGRIIAVIFVVAYNAAFKFSTGAGFCMMALLAAIFPWLIWKSLQFRLYNSSYRGIRFGFRGSLGKVYLTYLVLPLLSLLTLYGLIPFTHQRIKKFQHEESRFGDTPFSFDGSVGSFYKVYLIGFLVASAGMALITVVFGGAVFGVIKAGGLKTAGPAVFGTLMLYLFLLYAWLFLMFPIFLTLMQNLVWGSTRLGAHQFHSRMGAGRMVFIAITNLVGIALTLGFFIPFAQVRTMKYRIESMSLTSLGSIDSFVAGEQAQASATGEGMADLFDFDLSL